MTLATVINCVGSGFRRGTHTRWQLVANDGTGAPTLTYMGGSFAIATGDVLTLFVAAPPHGSSVWVPVVDEVTGAVFEQEISADLPANTQFLSPRLFMNNRATAAAVAYDCSGVYVETDYSEAQLLTREAPRGTGKLLVNEPALASRRPCMTGGASHWSFDRPIKAPSTTAPSAVRPGRSISRPPPSTSPWRTPIRWPSRRRLARLGSSASASIRARASPTSTSAPARQWCERFPARPVPFAAETPPALEVLAQSRTMKGSGAAGVATLGTGGVEVEVAQSILAGIQTAILPLVPYLDTLRWVFIVVALGGIAVTIYARLDDWRRGQR